MTVQALSQIDKVLDSLHNSAIMLNGAAPQSGPPKSPKRVDASRRRSLASVPAIGASQEQQLYSLGQDREQGSDPFAGTLATLHATLYAGAGHQHYKLAPHSSRAGHDRDVFVYPDATGTGSIHVEYDASPLSQAQSNAVRPPDPRLDTPPRPLPMAPRPLRQTTSPPTILPPRPSLAPSSVPAATKIPVPSSTDGQNHLKPPVSAPRPAHASISASLQPTARTPQPSINSLSSPLILPEPLTAKLVPFPGALQATSAPRSEDTPPLRPAIAHGPMSSRSRSLTQPLSQLAAIEESPAERGTGRGGSGGGTADRTYTPHPRAGAPARSPLSGPVSRVTHPAAPKVAPPAPAADALPMNRHYMLSTPPGRTPLQAPASLIPKPPSTGRPSVPLTTAFLAPDASPPRPIPQPAAPVTPPQPQILPRRHVMATSPATQPPPTASPPAESPAGDAEAERKPYDVPAELKPRVIAPAPARGPRVDETVGDAPAWGPHDVPAELKPRVVVPAPARGPRVEEALVAEPPAVPTFGPAPETQEATAAQLHAARAEKRRRRRERRVRMAGGQGDTGLGTAATEEAEAVIAVRGRRLNGVGPATPRGVQRHRSAAHAAAAGPRGGVRMGAAGASPRPGMLRTLRYRAQALYDVILCAQ